MAGLMTAVGVWLSKDFFLEKYHEVFDECKPMLDVRWRLVHLPLLLLLPPGGLPLNASRQSAADVPSGSTSQHITVSFAVSFVWRFAKTVVCVVGIIHPCCVCCRGVGCCAGVHCVHGKAPGAGE